MTEILYSRFCKRWGKEQVHIYGAHERLYLSLPQRELLGIERQLISLEEIDEIAKRIFPDVPFVVEERGDVKQAVFFEPRKVDDYSSRHSHHFLQVHSLFCFPEFTVSTGHRGTTALHTKQRTNYFNFVESVVQRFIENSKK